MTILAIISFVIFAAFVTLSVLFFKWQKSYSTYAPLWGKKVPIDNVNLWSAVTMVCALLLLVAMIGLGEDSKWQFLGFLAPVYLVIVSLTPNYQDEDKKKQKLLYIVAASVCAACSLLWIILVVHLWWVPLITFACAAAAAYFTKTWRACYIFWAEMAMFAAVYAITIFA